MSRSITETKEITVYTKSNCYQCKATFQALNGAGINYKVVDLERDPGAVEKVKALGYLQAPVIIAGDEHWAGFQPGKIQQLRSSGDSDGPQNPMNKIQFAHCDKFGVIFFSHSPDENSRFFLAGGAGDSFQKTVESLARPAREDPTKFLVPGVPEANSADEVRSAIGRFKDLIKESGQPGKPIPQQPFKGLGV